VLFWILIMDPRSNDTLLSLLILYTIVETLPRKRMKKIPSLCRALLPGLVECKGDSTLSKNELWQCSLILTFVALASKMQPHNKYF